MKQRTENKGFTLIELLVVVAIIGLLASIVIASLNTARQKGRDARRVADGRQMQNALELYNDATSGFPAATSSVGTTYISVWPTDPANSATYYYQYKPRGSASVTTAPCPGYHLAAMALEVSGSAALTSAAHIAAGTTCASTADFSCNGVTQCYDVIGQ
jgi:prepilin-type N-terminal cleavage/methylation domain-containing protein